MASTEESHKGSKALIERDREKKIKERQKRDSIALCSSREHADRTGREDVIAEGEGTWAFGDCPK